LIRRCLRELPVMEKPKLPHDGVEIDGRSFSKMLVFPPIGRFGPMAGGWNRRNGVQMKIHVLIGKRIPAPEEPQRIEALAVATEQDLDHYAYSLEAEKESWEMHGVFERLGVAVLEVDSAALNAFLDQASDPIPAKILKQDQEG